MIVSADTLVYFGDLDAVFAAAAGALRPGGLFIFTLEHAVAGRRRCRLPPGVARPLQPRPRLRRAVARPPGLQPEIADAELRMEAGAPVPGLVIRAAKRIT